MISGIESNKIYEDVTHAGGGILIWTVFMGCVFFGISFFMFVYLIFNEVPSFTEDYIVILIGFCLLGLSEFTFLTGFYFSYRTVQKLILLKSKFIFSLYYGRKIEVSIKDIVTCNETKVSKMMSIIRTFPRGGNYLELILKNKRRYLISCNIDNYEELKETLKLLVNDSNEKSIVNS